MAAWATRVFAGYQRPAWAPPDEAPHPNGPKAFTVVEASPHTLIPKP